MFRLFKKILAPYKKPLIIAPLMKIFEVVVDLITPLIIAYMINTTLVQKDLTILIRCGILLVVLYCIGFALTLVCQKMASRVCVSASEDLRNDIFKHINHLSQATLDTLSASTLTNRIIDDVNYIQVAIAMLIRQVIRWPVLALGSMIAAIMLNPHLGLIFVISIPLIVGAFVLITQRTLPHLTRQQEKLDELHMQTQQALDGQKTIRGFLQQDTTSKKFASTARVQTQESIRANSISALLNPASFIILNFGICVVLFLGAKQVQTGISTPGEIMAFIGYLNQMLVSIGYVANLIIIFTRAQASSVRILEILDLPVEKSIAVSAQNSQPKRKIQPKDTTPVISCDNLSFSYPHTQKPVLHNISFSLNAGHILGVCGACASGKSTLLKVCAGLYPVDHNMVYIYDQSIENYLPEELSDIRSIIFQKPQLISGTIEQNLAWQDCKTSQEEIMHALSLAQADSFITSPQDKICNAGTNFSGGQKQRIAYARGFIGNKKLLLLDDCFSALDTITASKARKALRQYCTEQNCACILASQHINDLRMCDQVLVLSHGTQEALGTHYELEKSSQTYREFVQTQNILKGRGEDER